MWRKLLHPCCLMNILRNTSTYVEKTPWVYFCVIASLETPPRMWRKLGNIAVRITLRGNTSTYVEKTSAAYLPDRSRRKHLHVCGENFAIGQ